MAGLRAVQEENEEMGKELAQGKVHGLEQQVRQLPEQGNVHSLHAARLLGGPAGLLGTHAGPVSGEAAGFLHLHAGA